MVKKTALIIDDTDFCLLMSFYLSKRNFEVVCEGETAKGLKYILLKRPDLIIAEKRLRPNLEDNVNNIVNLMDDYMPEIQWIDSQGP